MTTLLLRAAVLWLLLGVSVAHAADLGRPMLGWPSPLTAVGTITMASAVRFVLDASTDQAEYVFQTPEAITITQACYLYGLRALTPPTYSISLQTIGTDGNPTGTDVGGGSPTLVTFTPPADTSIDATVVCQTLTNAYTTARGQFLVIVIAYSAGTVNGTNNSSFAMSSATSAIQTAGSAFPYTIQNDAGVRTRMANSVIPFWGYRSASKSFGFLPETNATTSFSSDSTPDEYALRFSLPAASCSTFSVVGMAWNGSTPAAAKTVVLTLYDGTTALQTVTWDSDVARAAATTNSQMTFYFDEATLSVLTCGTVYRLAMAPQETASNLAVKVFTFDTAGDLGAVTGTVEWYLSTRTDAGAWTDTTTSLPLIVPLLQDVTEPAGSGGRIIGG